MKNLKFLALSAFTPMFVMANSIAPNVEEDLLFQGKVQIQNVTDGTVKLEGTGTLTIAATGFNHFPQVLVFGGSTISGDDWRGDIQAPTPTTKPSATAIREAGSNYMVESAYQMDPNNPIKFSPEALIAFEMPQPDGSIVDILVSDKAGKWTKKDSCIVEDHLCVGKFSEFTKVALVLTKYERCPADPQNGEFQMLPLCNLKCDKGYENTLKNTCIKSEGTTDESFELLSATTPLVPASNSKPLVATNPQVVDHNRNGRYIRYRGSREQFNRELDNKDFGARSNAVDNIRRNQVEEVTTEHDHEDDGMMTYLINMRNHFGANSSVNDFGGEENTATSDNENDGKSDEWEGHSSGPLLPSTGPGIFLAITAAGAGIMLLSRRRRD